MTISTHSYTVTVPAAADAALTITGGRITLDESWAPYIQGTLNCAAPDADVLAALDPRQNPAPRVTLTMLQQFADGTPARSFTADLGVRSTRVRAGVLTLGVASDEALAQDAALVIDLGSTITVTLAHRVDMFLGFIDATLAPSSDAQLVNTWQRFAPGMEIWGTVQPYVQQAGLRLYCDETRTWRLVPADQTTTDVVRLGDVAKVLGLEDIIDRDGDAWADGVVIVYKWRDEAGDQQEATDTDSIGYPPSKVKVIEYDATYPGPGAATHVLARAQARGHQLDVRAVSDYLARPGHQFVVPLDDGTYQQGHIVSVSWSIDDDRMTITPRDLEPAELTAWILLEPGETWADSAPGTPWTTP